MKGLLVMKQAASNKYNIAWFKLADCVSRGEKERALGVYRLLSHSVDDQALMRQLEGDLLLAFQDEGAADTYKQAIQLYKDDERHLEAAALYEHLLTLQPHTQDYHLCLVDLYTKLRLNSKVEEHLNTVFEQAMNKKQWEKATEMANKFDEVGEGEQAAQVHEQLVFALLEDTDVSQDLVMDQVHKVINACLRFGDQQKLQQFLSKLKVVDNVVHERACKKMNEG